MNEQEKLEKKHKIRTYVWTAGILVVLVALMFFLIEKPHEEPNVKDVIGAISNCFIVPAALLGGVGAISYMATLGAYDGLIYSLKNFGLHNLIGGNPMKKKTQTFREYKEQKDEKGRKWFPNFLWVGVASLIIGIILAIVYLLM